MNDHDLIAALAAGDDTALRVLFDRHAPWLAGRLRRRLPAAAVEDVLQETFVAVWHNAHQYRASADVGGWIWGIARRQAAQWLRTEGRPDPCWEAPSELDPAATGHLRADLTAALRTLADDEDALRLAQMALIEEHSMNELADHFGIQVGTVKSRLHKLRQTLRRYLRKRGY